MGGLSKSDRSMKKWMVLSQTGRLFGLMKAVMGENGRFNVYVSFSDQLKLSNGSLDNPF